ncbi:MAG: GNAT family N-acetyltransferase [Saprospirales bacterium]|nr:GNAT family N-acetyltransferase [Saprospirales bacterium]
MLTYRCKAFNELNLLQLYAIMALRQEVFVVEQNCPYLDADGKDLAAHHLVGYDDNGNTVAYARLLPKGVSYEHHASMGRIVTKPSVRGRGLGKELMKNALDWADRLYPNESIKISAQTYLRKFYEDFGFVVSGEEYLEDGIPHLPMVRG